MKLCRGLATGLATSFLSGSIASALSDQFGFEHIENILSPAPEAVSGPALTYIPAIGLGTWLSEKPNVTAAVEWALKAGYRHIDAAHIYGNEKEVGKGIAKSGLPRSNLWITSKLWNNAHRPADVKPALKKTLSHLGIDYLDLYLMHWPVAFDPTKKGTVVDKSTSIVDTWKAMEGLVHAGLTKNIGISNFAKHEVETILKHCSICPAAHEFETHPYLQQQEFVNWHRTKGIQVIAYSPFANVNPTYGSKIPSILHNPFFLGLGAKHNATAAQAILAWGMQRGTVVIPKSIHEARILENLASTSIRYSELEMKAIGKVDQKLRFNNPSEDWGVKLFSDLDGA